MASIPCFLNAQSTIEPTDVSKVLFSIQLSGRATFATSDTIVSNELIPDLKFTEPILGKYAESLSLKMTGKIIYLRFGFYNSSDSVKQFYFFPGFYFTDMKILKSGFEKNRLIEIKKNEIDKNSTGFALLSVDPKRKRHFLCKTLSAEIRHKLTLAGNHK